MYKTTPRPYQRNVVEQTWDKPAMALFLDPGLGKSKIVMDTASKLYEEGKIQCLIVVSKKVVVENWLLEELPKHLACSYQATLYSTTRKKTAVPAKFASKEGLKVVLINDGAIRTGDGFQFLRDYLNTFRTLFVIDESTIIKNPTSQISKRVHELAKLADYRRVVCGEPAPQGPVDYFSQYWFLDSRIINVKSFFAYKNIYCEQKSIWINGREIRKPTQAFTEMGGPDFERKVKPFTVRIRKGDVLKELPEKNYIQRRFYLGKEAQKLYDTLKKEYFAEFEVEGKAGTINATVAASRVIRLHQIACGYVPAEVSGSQEVLSLDTSRFDALCEIIDERPVEAKTIIWAHYRYSIDMLEKKLQEVYGKNSVRKIYGGLEESTRTEALQSFREKPEVRFLVANAATAGWGLTLTEADAAVYYANSYNWEHRLQSEDRIHRIGQMASSVDYYDLIAEGTVDEKILQILQSKADFTNSVLTDYANWIKL